MKHRSEDPAVQQSAKALPCPGFRVARLTVLELASRDRHGRKRWRCRCDCGNIVERLDVTLKSGGRSACDVCIAKFTSLLKTKHGAATNWKNGGPTRLYSTWTSMHARCSNPKAQKYPLYGARGIRVCEEWKAFEVFRSWAEANGYADNLTIERIDPNWHYEPSNCEWVTREVNSSRSKHSGHYWRSMTLTA